KFMVLTKPIAIVMGNGSKVLAKANGTIQLLLNKSHYIEIEALYSPEMRFFLLSVSSLSNKFAVAFQEGICYISGQQLGSKQIPIAQLQSGLWRLCGRPFSMSKKKEMLPIAKLPRHPTA